MIYSLKYEDECKKFLVRVEQFVKDGATVNLTKKNPQRTIAQNRYMYLLLAYFGCEYGVSTDEAKNDYFKRLCNPDLFVRERENKHGKIVRYLRSSSTLSTSEMTLAIDRFRHWSAMEAQIYLPSPEDREFLTHCEQEIERNKEFVQYQEDYE